MIVLVLLASVLSFSRGLAASDRGCEELGVLESGWAEAIAEHSEWWYEPAALAFWALLLSLTLRTFFARRQDRRLLKEHFWEPENLLTTDPAYSGQSVPKEVQLVGFRRVSVNASCLCVRLSFARTHRFVAADVQSVLAGAATWGIANVVRTPVMALADELGLHEGLEAAIAKVQNAGFCGRALIVFMGSHPWFSLAQRSISTSGAARALLLECELLVALMLNAMAILMSDESLSWKSQDSCSHRSLDDYLAQSIFFGVGTTALTVISVFPVRSFRRHPFVYRTHWNRADQARKHLLCWMRKDALVMMFLLCCCFFSIFIIVVFLANAHKRENLRWLVSAAAVLASEFIIGPGLFSLVVALASRTSRRRAAELAVQVKRCFRVEPKILPVTDVPPPLVVTLEEVVSDSADDACDHGQAPSPHATISYTPDIEDHVARELFRCSSPASATQTAASAQEEWYYAEPKERNSPPEAASQPQYPTLCEEESIAYEEPPELLVYSNDDCGQCRFVSDRVCVGRHKEVCVRYAGECTSFVDTSCGGDPYARRGPDPSDPYANLEFPPPDRFWAPLCKHYSL